MTSQFFTNKLLDRFWSKTNLVGPCWVWKSAKNNKGYGFFHLGDKVVLAHRLSYQMYYGLVPKDKELDHLCKNTLCVNPTHLEPVTHKENTMRGDTITSDFSKRTHCKNGHEFKGDDFYWRSDGKGRRCRICAYNYNKKGRNHE